MCIEIKHGCTRIVILVNKYAIKIPTYIQWNLFLKGLLGNMQETLFSKTGWPELCPVIFSVPGGFLNVMLRATSLPRSVFDNFDAYTFCHKQDYVVPAEKKIDSFGLLNGKIVAVDYGS